MAIDRRELIKKLEAAGYKLDRNSGHQIYEKEGARPVQVPHKHKKELKKGTAEKILKDAGLK